MDSADERVKDGASTQAAPGGAGVRGGAGGGHGGGPGGAQGLAEPQPRSPQPVAQQSGRSTVPPTCDDDETQIYTQIPTVSDEQAMSDLRIMNFATDPRVVNKAGWTAWHIVGTRGTGFGKWLPAKGAGDMINHTTCPKGCMGTAPLIEGIIQMR